MASSRAPQHVITRAYESFLDEHGDSYRGVGWTRSQAETDLRYRVMLELIDGDGDAPVSLLDVGCGLAHLHAYMQRQPPRRPIAYSGLDLSRRMLAIAREKFPKVRFYELDLLAGRGGLPQFDYVVMNGVFTYKADLTYEEMLSYWQALLPRAFELAERGLAFNVMSTSVEWERDDLFHLPFDVLTRFVVDNLSRRFVIRHDYPLFEYTTYVYR